MFKNLLLCEVLSVDNEVIIIEDKKYIRTFVRPSQRVEIHAYFEISGEEENKLAVGQFVSASNCYLWNESEVEKENIVCLRVEAPYQIEKGHVDIPYVHKVTVEGSILRGPKSLLRGLPSDPDRKFLPFTASIGVGQMRRLYLLALAFEDVAVKLDAVETRSLCRFSGVLNNTRQKSGHEFNLVGFKVLRPASH